MVLRFTETLIRNFLSDFGDPKVLPQNLRFFDLKKIKFYNTRNYRPTNIDLNQFPILFQFKPNLKPLSLLEKHELSI